MTAESEQAVFDAARARALEGGSIDSVIKAVHAHEQAEKPKAKTSTRTQPKTASKSGGKS